MDMIYVNMYMYILFDKMYGFSCAVGGTMTIVNATKLRNNLFAYLTRVAEGESITIQKNGEDLAMIVPPQKKDWRSNMGAKVKFSGPTEKVFAPLEDLWEGYL